MAEPAPQAAPAPVVPEPVAAAPAPAPTPPVTVVEPEAPEAPETPPTEAEAEVEETRIVPTIVPVKSRAKAPKPPKAVAVETVPESRRARIEAKREAKEQAKAAKAASKASTRKKHERPPAAEVLVSKLPTMKPAYAAILTGLLSGLACVLLAKGASLGCEAIRTDNSCGGGVGLLTLVAILAIEVLIGANLLKAWRVSDPFSTAFLGVGVVAMIAMLVFLEDLNSPAMLVVIPLLTAAAFLLSWWVTVRFVEEDEPHLG